MMAPVRAVLFDIDDTFSLDGKILPEAFHALWALNRKGYATVPVTGRPAGWCDHIARMWPVTGIIGENGAFYIRCKPRLQKVYLESSAVRARNAKKRETLRKQVLKKFVGARHPSDQAFREFDFAIDISEDVTPWTQTKIDRLLDFCRAKGASAKLSSIHVNVWYGKYDKWTCAKKFLKNELKIQDLNEVVYLGDSPNDEPFFEALPRTVGVSNIQKFLPQLEYRPSIVTQNPGSLGFAEFAKTLLE